MTRRTIEVEVDLSEFSDAEIQREASARGLSNEMADRFANLGAAIENGDRISAHILLSELAGDSHALREAAERGRRRVR